MQALAAREAFTMDPNLLVSVIRSQAGTLTKALLEGVMNSIDAGARAVHITLDASGFRIEDDGRGFATEEEIRQWFGRFGTPHAKGDATYGRFRMGRGQLFSHAATVWTSNRFRMSVDLNTKGLTYALEPAPEPFAGCRIEGVLYETLTETQLAETLTELRKFVAFTPQPVYVNGRLFGASAARLKTWTHETEDAWIRLNPEAEELAVYNQGVFVCAMPTWKVGMGGVVVSKSALEVNFARNAVMERDCPVWSRIRTTLEQLIFTKLARAERLSEGERSYLARRVRVVTESGLAMLERAKVLTEPGGRHVPLSELREAHTLVHAARPGTMACQMHGNGVFVVTDRVIERFGAYSFDDFIERMREIPGLLREDLTVSSFTDARTRLELGQTSELARDVLTKRQRAALAALSWLNQTLVRALIEAGYAERERELLVARQRRNSAVAWTDGKQYVTVNVRHLDDLETGVDGAQRWAYTLLHEYMHDTDDSESHDHGEVFFQKFHDALFDSRVGTGRLAQDTLLVYLAELKALGLKRPRALSKNLEVHMPR